MLNKIFNAVDKYFEIWIMVIAVITGIWVLYRVIQFLIW
jgi:hypothetical protein